MHMAIAALMLTFAARAHAESPREELAHAYVLLKMAKHDYGGHKATALHEIEAAGHELGMNLEGRGNEHERQMKSDELVSEADRMLHEARDKMEDRDRKRVARHLEVAIREVDAALRKR